MADRTDFKMFHFIFFVAIIFTASASQAKNVQFEEGCSCYDKCASNFTTNSVLDVVKTGACQRGCRFYALAIYTSHEENAEAEAVYAKNSCLMSCHESYKVEYEQSACIAGCSHWENGPCNNNEDVNAAQFSVSLTSETDVVFSAAEFDPDYVHTDPGLRNQIGLSEEAFTESKPKLPEIRFRDLPVKTEKSFRTHIHSNFKCPKYYELDSKMRFKNGPIIYEDFYLLAALFIFVFLCFLVGRHAEKENVTPKRKAAPMSKKDKEERERILREKIPDETWERLARSINNWAYDIDNVWNKLEKVVEESERRQNSQDHKERKIDPKKPPKIETYIYVGDTDVKFGSENVFERENRRKQKIIKI